MRRGSIDIPVVGMRESPPESLSGGQRVRQFGKKKKKVIVNDGKHNQIKV